MTFIRIKGDKNKYDIRDRHCIGRPCLTVHQVSSRTPTTSGSRLTGYRYCCTTREYSSCPQPIPGSDPKLAAGRRRNRMKNET